MNQQLKNAANAAFSAALSGAVLALFQIGIDPNHMDWKHTGSVALGGAVMGLINHYRTPPTVTAQQAQILQSTPAGQIAQAENAIAGAVTATVIAKADKVAQEAK